uniref:Uncharacterized protein n=1 Tax=Strigamia maritima TaxID=126957 RepID=T1IPC3_STRMM
MKTSIALCIFTIAVVYAAGPEAEDDKWEECNSITDNGLAYLGNFLNETEFYSIVAVDPCTKCKVWDLGTIKRTADTHFNKVEQGDYKHELKLGFTVTHIRCDCEANTGVKTVKGELHAVWTEPRFSLNFVHNPKKQKTTFEKCEVSSDFSKACTQECKGSDEWKQSCQKLKDQGSFETTLKNSIEGLFPVESTKKSDNDSKLAKKLFCGKNKD